jgi:AbrB family looped-hinge helix DNA binding protein
MRFTTTTTSKGQLTIPKEVRDKLKLKNGTKVDLYPTTDGRFIGVPHKPSKIMSFMGDLKHLDKDKLPLREIRDRAQTQGAKELVNRK